MRLSPVFMTSLMLMSVFFANAQVAVSPWEIHEGNEGVQAHEGKFAGDPSAYKLAKMPAKNDAAWKTAPLDAKGNVFMKRTSTLKCRKEVDFTYFQTIVNVPANTVVTDFKVSYDNADDGARIYFFNSKFPNGTFDEKSDLVGKGSQFSSTNLKDKVAPGENRILVVQFDDCAVGNNISGIHVQVNGKEVAPVANVLTIYEHFNYGGKTKSFGVGTYDITQTEFNDIVSSLKILKGYKVTLYKDWKTTGDKVVITADTADLNKLNFNDFTSSLKVEAL